MRPTKPAGERHSGVGISLPGRLEQLARRRARALGNKSFSEYLRDLIERDLSLAPSAIGDGALTNGASTGGASSTNERQQ